MFTFRAKRKQDRTESKPLGPDPGYAGVGKRTIVVKLHTSSFLSWPDAFPHTDLGVMKALGETDAQRVRAAGEAWRPWRAYAVMHLWQSLTRE